MNKVKFTKITSTPTNNAWSQTYSAGNFAALIALEQSSTKTKSDVEKVELQTVGHEIVSTLESEYFTLENKNLASIKQAVSTAAEKIPEDVKANLIVITVVDNILYGFLYGGGKILLKRGDKIGLLLEKPTHAVSETETKQTVISVSGHLENQDIVVLASKTLLDIFSEEKLFTQLTENNPDETAEMLMPQLQKKKEGAACAILLSYHNEQSASAESLSPIGTPPTTEPEAATSIENQPISPNPSLPAVASAKAGHPSFPSFPSFSKPRLGLILLACVIALLIIGSIFITIHKKQQDQEHAKFQAVYSAAQSKYDEGQNLLALNKQKAHDDFTATISLLKPFEGKLTDNPSDNTQLTTLLTKANTALSQIENGVPTSAKQTTESDSPLLAAENKQNTLYVTQDSKSIYLADANGVTTVDSTSQKATIAIKNSGDWDSLGGLGTYLGNIYVLDKKSTILKYVPASSGFGKSNYLKGKVDLSNATELAIDGDVYVLFTDGSIQKFTKGIKQSFSVSGLEKPMKNPTRIFTTIDASNIYILDNGNGRVVVLNKNGAYQNQYTSDILASAKDFDVHEKDKKIFTISQDKIWEIDMK